MIRHIVLLVVPILAASAADFEVHKLENAYHLLKTTPDLDWWKTAVFYQIYPRSFMDSDGDGIGDLQGIIQKLDHLQHAGVTAAWLSPIYKSPQVDQGYDISDYLSIDSDYGSLDDFKDLLSTAKELGLKIILDFVPNHSSDQHDWFTKSVNRVEGYEDFYVWRDGVIDANQTSPPNNWISVFKGSAWEYVEARKQYYYHAFTVQQPDLNYSNPLVVKAMKDVLTYWMDLGVDGFRFDAVPYLFEDQEFKDAPLAAGKTYDVNDTSCLENIYINHLQSTYDLIYEFRAHIDNYTTSHNIDAIVMMTEAYGTIEQEVLYYGSPDNKAKGAHFTFNFDLISSITNLNFTISQLALSIDRWLAYLPKQYASNWVLGNHDQRRVPTRFGKENVDGFNMLTSILPGVMVTYNGEEIGMEDGEVTCDQGYDPQAIIDCSTFSKTSRDFERTPYQWDDTELGGFTTGKPWLPVSNKTKEVNLRAQNITGISSHYNVYRDLMKFRKNFQNESAADHVSVLKLSDNVLQIFRRVDDIEFSLLFNVGKDNDTVDFFKTKANYVVVVASVNSSYVAGASVGSVELQAHEAVIVQSVTSSQSRAQALTVAPCLLFFMFYKLFYV